MANSHHIFSLRGEDGNRLSTLTVQDYFDGRTRKLRFVENGAKLNHPPPEVAVKAAHQLINMVNEGAQEIQILWEAIDESKAPFLAQQLDSSVGYDFRSAEQRERILELYEPCLSRKVLRRRSKTFENFAEAIGVQAQIDQFLSSRNTDIGGIVKISGRPETIRPNNPEQGAHYG